MTVHGNEVLTAVWLWFGRSWHFIRRAGESFAKCAMFGGVRICMLPVGCKGQLEYISDIPASGMKPRHRNVKLTKMYLKGCITPLGRGTESVMETDVLSADDGANRVEKDNGI